MDKSTMIKEVKEAMSYDSSELLPYVEQYTM